MADEAKQAREVLSFGPFNLVAGERLLTKDGAQVELGGRALDLLLQLVANAPAPIGKRELMAAVWPGVTVDEGSLRVHIARLREAIGDGRNGARYIATLSGRGYCFVAPIFRAGPPAAVQSPPNTNLPLRTELIGRDEELADIAALLGRERLVTIVGPGGVGKTRLAIASGWRSAAKYPDGVWLIDLAPLSDPSLVTSSIATALDLTRGALALSAESIAAAIRDRRLLLILDNCEHLVAAASEVADELLQRVPGLSMLATSQEGLRLDPERIYRLDPLALPPSGAAVLEAYGAVALFVQRALAADRRFVLNEANATGIAEICRRLDGVPLSLEMAAARLLALGLEGLQASLDARLHLLSTGMRTSDVRHRTLRNTVEWSVGLLDEREHRVFRQLGVFSGGFSLEAVLAVAGEGQADSWIVADALGRLIDKSLVTLEKAKPARYRLLETLRLYAQDALRASGEWDALSERHARHFCEVFALAQDALETTPTPEWEAAYIPELDNLRSALDWTLADPRRRNLAVKLNASSGFVWIALSLIEEGRRRVDRAMSLVDDRTSPAQAAMILHDAGKLLRRHQDQRGALELAERSAAIYRRLGDKLGLAKVNITIAEHFLLVGNRHAEAAEVMRGVRETLSAAGYDRSSYAAINVLGAIAMHQQDFAGAIEDFSLVKELGRRLRDTRDQQIAVHNVALAEFCRGHVDRAIELAREAVSGARDIWFRPRALHNLAAYLIAAGRLVEARPVAEEALSGRSEADSLTRLSLQAWALIAALEGRYSEAAQLIGWVDAAYRAAGEGRNPWEQRSYERLLSILEAPFTEDERNRFAAEGAAWAAPQALNFAFDHVIRARDPALPNPTPDC